MNPLKHIFHTENSEVQWEMQTWLESQPYRYLSLQTRQVTLSDSFQPCKMWLIFESLL